MNKQTMKQIKDQIKAALVKKVCYDCMSLKKKIGFLKRESYRCAIYDVTIDSPRIADHDCAFFLQKSEKVKK